VTPVLVIGGGPAGLMAAETVSAAGLPVLLAEARPSVGRKFLMAGKSGLNITHAGTDFAAGFQPPEWRGLLAGFGPDRVQDWCRGLGQPVFTGSSGRVFPQAMKASPLLRAWAARLAAQGVAVRTRWRWTGFDGATARFAAPDGPQAVAFSACVLALGGGSWARLGSDGAWAPVLRGLGVAVEDFAPANMGFRVDWSPAMARFFGTPVKGCALVLPGGRHERGEFVVSARGVEGGGIYAVSRDLRQGAGLALDLFPDLTPTQAAARLAGRAGDSLGNRLRKARLAPVAAALAQEWGRPLPPDPAALAARLKALPVPLAGPRPIDEAISTAGGIARAAVTDDLELVALPRVFAAGEMLGWEAPTGGWLITGCLATGRRAGQGVLRRLGAA
jgi:uncharacterized flavoprotein (TIGR03862 family)